MVEFSNFKFNDFFSEVTEGQYMFIISGNLRFSDIYKWHGIFLTFRGEEKAFRKNIRDCSS